MEVLLALVAVFLGGMLALYAFALVGSCLIVGSITLIIYVLPRLCLAVLLLTLRGAIATIWIAASTLRKCTGTATRGLTVWEVQPRWQQQAQERTQHELDVPVIDSWEAACTLLGLPAQGFRKSELSRAYRKAIVTAHPDVGGNPARAKAVNIARDLIRQKQGWT